MNDYRRNHPQPMRPLLEKAQKEGYAVGSFSGRYLPMIRAIFDAAREERSPVIVQISGNELKWFSMTPGDFFAEIEASVEVAQFPFAYAVHLDHCFEPEVIANAIDVGFSSVMIDASKHDLDTNIAKTRAIVDYAHARGVTVEAELGKIGTTDTLETDNDEEQYTDPKEAERFVRETGVDCLAISIGTAHGVYLVKNPKIDFDRLAKIRALVDIPLVLHGGTGVPEASIKKSLAIPGGGISKINIATELEQAFLAATGKEKRMMPAEVAVLSSAQIAAARAAITAVVREKMSRFLGSSGHA